MTILKVVVPAIGLIGAVGTLSATGVINFKNNDVGNSPTPENNSKNTPVVQADTERDYFLLAKNNIASLTMSFYPTDDLYSSANNTKTKNFKCQVIENLSTAKAENEGIFDCDVYKYELPHPIAKDITSTEINTPSEDKKLSTKSELFKDNLFQIVVKKEIFEAQKTNPNLKVRLLKNGETGNNKWFSNLEGLAWYHKNNIQPVLNKTSMSVLSEINKTINTSYLLAKVDTDESGLTSENNDSITTENGSNPKAVSYKCKISKTGKDPIKTDCRVYKVDDTNWRIDSSRLQPPTENNLVLQKSHFANNKYYQIQLDSKALNSFENDRSLSVSLIKKGEDTKFYKTLKTLYEFKRGKKNGKAQHVVVQVQSKSTESGQNFTNQNTPNLYQYITAVNGVANKKILLHNLNGDTNGSITNKANVNNSNSNIKTVNITSSPDKQAIDSSIQNQTILIMSAETSNSQTDYFDLYNLVGSTFNIDIKIKTSVNDTNPTKKGSLIVKVIGTIAIRD